MYLIDAQGNTVASYEYDPYGNIISTTGSMAEINPLRYRGYYYDSELEMYYLQSRYYDSAIGRFINADVYASTGQGVLGFNMFSYCINGPVNRVDSGGEISSRSTFYRSFDGYHVTTRIYEKKKSVICSYRITLKGVITFSFLANPYAKVVRYGFAKMLATVMYRLAKNINRKFLTGRTEKGIYREMTAHYLAKLAHVEEERAEIAHIGSLYQGSLGYDDNACWFE